MKLRIWTPGNRKPDIRPAPKQRMWADAVPGGHAYKCLPMNIGSMYGWQVHLPHAIEAVWNGGGMPKDVQASEGIAEGHFGSGILTFFPGFIFRCPVGWDVLVTGPTNSVKRGITPLTGVIEYDSGLHTWSMNWKFTEENRVVRWEKGEAYCQFWPVKRGTLENVDICVQSLPEQHRAAHLAWCEKRVSDNGKGLDWSREYYKRGFQKRLNLKPVRYDYENDQRTDSGRNGSIFENRPPVNTA